MWEILSASNSNNTTCGRCRREQVWEEVADRVSVPVQQQQPPTDRSVWGPPLPLVLSGLFYSVRTAQTPQALPFQIHLHLCCEYWQQPSRSPWGYRHLHLRFVFVTRGYCKQYWITFILFWMVILLLRDVLLQQIFHLQIEVDIFLQKMIEQEHLGKLKRHIRFLFLKIFWKHFEA